MKLQTALLLLVSAVSVYSRAIQDAPTGQGAPEVQGAPAVQDTSEVPQVYKCRDLINKYRLDMISSSDKTENPKTIQDCMTCYGERGCLASPEGGEGLGNEAKAADCEKIECATIVFDT